MFGYRWKAPAWIVGAGLVVVGSPAGALAATVSSTGSEATYVAAAGEVNDVRVHNLFRSEQQPITLYRITDLGASIQAQPLCVPFVEPAPGGGAVACPARTDAEQLFQLGDRDDKLLISAVGNVRAEGQEGNDRLTSVGDAAVLVGHRGNDVLTGGPEADSFFGGDGDDLIEADDGVPENVSCGPGLDAVDADAADTISWNCEAVS